MKSKKSVNSCVLNKKENKPVSYLLSEIKEAEAEYKRGDYYSFKNPKEALKFLDKI